MNQRLMITVLILLMAGIMVGCGSQEAEEPPNDPITISMHLWPGYVHSFIAQEQGFFEEEGVEVELNIIENVPDNIAHFLDGRTDMAFGLQSDAMLLAALGFDLKIIYVADFSNGGDAIISTQEIESIAGLKGKTVSVDSLNSFFR